jgi:transposase-like protein
MAKVGRPSLYDPNLHPKLAFWLAQAGLTDEQIAEELAVHVNTLYEWRKVHPEFSESLKGGKATPDDEVEAALLRKAKGFKYVEGNKEKVALPDTTACIFWLKNRRPADWRDKRHHEVREDIHGPLTIVITEYRRADGSIIEQDDPDHPGWPTDGGPNRVYLDAEDRALL